MSSVMHCKICWLMCDESLHHTARLILLSFPLRSTQGHIDSWDVSRCNVADKWCKGRARKLLEALRSQGHGGASWAAHGHSLPQLRHQIQIPVPVHSLPEYVRLTIFNYQARIILYRSFILLFTALNAIPNTWFLLWFFTVSGVIPSRWTRRSSCAPSAQVSSSYWHRPSRAPPHLLPTLSKRITGLYDRSWRDKATRKWCGSLVQTLPLRLNSVKAEILSVTALKSWELSCTGNHREKGVLNTSVN